MIPVSTDYKRQLIAGNRNWLIKIPVYLKGNATNVPDFTLENQHIWDNGIVLDNATSNDSEFDIGAAIIGSLKVVIDNIHGNFSTYDFYDAKLTLYLGVQGDVDESDVQRYYRIGSYVVDQPDYNGSLITLNCLDNMTWFDVPFENITTTSTTAGQLVQDICTKVGVFLSTPQFPNYTTAINVTLEQKLNCREVLQYVAQICCCYCKIDRAGELALAWYDKSAIIGITDYDGGTFSTTTTPYSDGCDLDGGSFDPWTGGDIADGGTFSDLLNGAWLTQNFEMSVSTDDIVVTGVRVRNNTKNDNAYDVLWVDSTLEQTHDRYVLVIDNNPLITTQAQASTIANTVGAILAGLPIRGYTATSLADFSFETGDMVTIIDFRGNLYRTWITHFTFTTNNSERFSCGVQSVRQRSEQRYSGSVKTLAEANANAEDILTAYDNAVKALNELGQNAIGYNEYVQTVGGAKIMYRYNGSSHTTSTPPKFQGSTAVYKISGDGVFIALAANGDIAADGTCTFSNGYDANSGTAILNLIYAQGLNANWINAGTMSAARIFGGTLKLGGKNGSTYNVNGLCEVYNDSNVKKVTLDTTGITADAGYIGGIQINASGIGKSGSGSDMNGLHLNNGDFGVATSTASSWSVLCYGAETYRRTGWGKSCCVLWSGGDSGAGFHVAQGAPTDNYTHPTTFTAMKDNIFQVFVGDDLKAYFNETGAHVNNNSDERIKKNIKELAGEKVRKFFDILKPSSFAYRKGHRTSEKANLVHYGVVAQNIKEALETAGLNEDSVVYKYEDNDLYTVEYQELHGLALAGIKHLYEIVDKQQEEINLLKQEIALLKEKVGE